MERTILIPQLVNSLAQVCDLSSSSDACRLAAFKSSALTPMPEASPSSSAGGFLSKSAFVPSQMTASGFSPSVSMI